VTPARITKAMRAALELQDTDKIIAAALSVLEKRAKYGRDSLSSPQAVRDYVRLKLGGFEREEFHAVWLDAQNRVIELEPLFTGTLTQTSIYPREVVKSALRHNAAAVILAHNHPSGIAEPSAADQVLTETLKRALALVDVKVLDHFVVGGSAAVSFAERGLL
jgi:DNA repair protein RadC